MKKKMIVRVITWLMNLPLSSRLAYEVIIAFFMFHAILLGLALLGGFLVIVLGWDVSTANLTLGRIGMVIEFPLLLTVWVIGGILWWISYLIPGIDLDGENPVMFSVAVSLFYIYNMALIVGCLELIRWCASKFACPPDVLTPKNTASNVQSDQN